MEIHDFIYLIVGTLFPLLFIIIQKYFLTKNKTNLIKTIKYKAYVEILTMVKNELCKVELSKKGNKHLDNVITFYKNELIKIT